MSGEVRIAGGIVVDGTGNPPYQADVCIKDGLIVHEVQEDAAVVDARGRIVSPGFIDIHRHADLAALCDPAFGEAELLQGITTAVVGNCGLAPVPNRKETRAALMRYIEPCLGKMDGFSPETFGEYMALLDAATLPINIGAFCATGAVAVCAKGFGDAAFDERAEAEAARLVEDAMGEGAFGISTGIMYNPECYTPRNVFVKMASVAARYNGLMTCHIRSEGDDLVGAVDEAIKIAGMAGVRLNISHFKSTGKRNWGRRIHEAIARIDAARASGQDVMVDFYPYTSGATTLSSLLPSAVANLSPEDITTPEGGDALRKALENAPDSFDNMERAIGWDRITVSSVSTGKNAVIEGMSIARIADEWNTDGWDVVRKLMSEERGNVGIVLNSMSEEDVRHVAGLPYSMLISDALYGGGKNTHPRRYGAFARFLREYPEIPIETAIHKMTGMPAKRIGALRIGRIAEGCFADVAVFDPKRIADRATYTDSRKMSEGMERVFMRGVEAVKCGELTRRDLGRAIRREGR